MSDTVAGPVTELILEVFRLNGRILAAGDALVSDLGLSSARWQVLGAIAGAETPQPVARLAGAMGLSRQAVQRVVNEMAAAGWLGFAENPHHRRAKLVLMTPAGAAVYAAAAARQTPWAEALAAGVDPADLDAAAALLARLRARLDEMDAPSGPAPGAE